MVPRINVFAMSTTLSLKAAADNFIKEGYSRVPVYNDDLDQITGVLLYKDVVSYYLQHNKKNTENESFNNLASLVKPVLFAPETKKIATLLQDFRTRQIHIAIVVNEYGGTEGIVTIEDILEELVGEIADEYDIVDDEKLHEKHPSGGWVVDGKMTLIDLEKNTGILLPQSREYDTVGGYVFHCAATIPGPGWKVHNDLFDLEVIQSNERMILKVIIIPRKNNDSKL